MDQVITIGYRDRVPYGYKAVNCTSKSDDKYKLLSPFMTSNPYCYAGLSAKNVENAWQFSKVYPEYDDNGVPTPQWYLWRDAGFANYFAHRYPMGKGAKPLYSWWNGNIYGYVEARKNIYAPIYENSIKDTNVFLGLKQEYLKGTKICIQDFDTYPLEGATYLDAINNPLKPFGHGFVIYKMLTQ